MTCIKLLKIKEIFFRKTSEEHRYTIGPSASRDRLCASLGRSMWAITQVGIEMILREFLERISPLFSVVYCKSLKLGEI